MGRIKVVVWDILGICFYDARRTVIENISKSTGNDYSDVKTVLFDHLGPLLREGRLSFDNFKDAAKDAGVDLSKVDIEKEWFQLYKKRQGIEDLLKEVKEKGRKNISLSNNFPDLVDYLQHQAKFPFTRLFDKCLWSYEIGVRKPLFPIYNEMEEVAGVQGYQILMVDDKKENASEYLMDTLRVKTLIVPNRVNDQVVLMEVRRGLRKYGINVCKE